MGYQLLKADAERLFGQWARQWDVYAPKRMEGEGCFSDTDIVRYGKVHSLEEIEWEKKSKIRCVFSSRRFEENICFLAGSLVRSCFFSLNFREIVL